MNNPEVTSLFQFRPFNQYSLQLLINEIAWFSHPSSFNDPFDCAIYVDESRLEENIKDGLELKGVDFDNLPEEIKAVKEQDRDAFKTYQASLEARLEKAGILCLSRAYKSILMWAHYGDSHRGFVIEYERTPENPLAKAEPVNYQVELPSLTMKDISSDGDRFDELWLTKSEHWSYEEEWRLLADPGGKAYRFPCKVKSIIFGLKMNSENRFTLEQILDGRGVEFLEAVRSKDKFELQIQKCA